MASISLWFDDPALGENVTFLNQFSNHEEENNDLVSQLPLALIFRDYAGQEKVSPAPRVLTMQGVPRGDDPEMNDLGYYAPSHSLVLYYSNVGYWDGIVRLGQFESSIEAIRTLPDGFTVTIALRE